MYILLCVRKSMVFLVIVLFESFAIDYFGNSLFAIL